MSNSVYKTLKDLLGHPDFIEGRDWHQKTYDANKMVIVEGEVGSKIYVVLKGTLMACTDVKITKDRHMSSGLCELFDGEEFAHSCFFDSEPHSASIKALTPCNLAEINVENLKAILQKHPDIGYQILYHWIEILLIRGRKGNQRISSLLSWGLKAHDIQKELQ